MATRSMIAMVTEDGVLASYCHFDGYPKHHGPILLECYGSREKVEELLSYGDMSVLCEFIGEQHSFVERSIGYGTTNPWDNWCLFCGRDRGEKNTEASHYPSVFHLNRVLPNLMCEYLYLYTANDEWVFKPIEPRRDIHYEYQSLSDYMNRLNEEAQS